MPTVTLLADVMPSLLPMTGRSPGVHISNIIHHLCVKLKHYVPSDAPNLAQWELGNAWEWAVIERYCRHDPSRYHRLGELEFDGLFGTPDMVDLVDDAVHEFKCTWMSVKWQPGSKKFWKYERQAMSYCHMLGWTKARLEVMFVAGNYIKADAERFAKYRKWEYNFTKDELKRNWQMLKRHEKETAEEMAATNGGN